jgi:hypothetical protein
LDDFSMNMEHKMCGFKIRAQQLTPHRSLGILREIFPGHVVSLRGDIGSLPHTSDLNPCDYLKAQVYQHCPVTFGGFKEELGQEVAAIPHEMTRRVMEKYRESLNQCTDNESRHLSDASFKF